MDDFHKYQWPQSDEPMGNKSKVIRQNKTALRRLARRRIKHENSRLRKEYR